MLRREQKSLMETRSLLRQQVAYREEITHLRGELFNIKVMIVVVMLFVWYVGNEASVKNRAWFGDNGIDMLSISGQVVGCLATLGWFYWTYLNAERCWRPNMNRPRW